MVRLEVRFRVRNLFNAEFQFLYGAIGSPPPVVLKPIVKSFNSYMVRLEAYRLVPELAKGN